LEISPQSNRQNKTYINAPDGIYVKYYSKEKETGRLKQLEENILFNELIHIINDNILDISMDNIIFSSIEFINPSQIPIKLNF